jgi:hypothetical protein
MRRLPDRAPSPEPDSSACEILLSAWSESAWSEWLDEHIASCLQQHRTQRSQQSANSDAHNSATQCFSLFGKESSGFGTFPPHNCCPCYSTTPSEPRIKARHTFVDKPGHGRNSVLGGLRCWYGTLCRSRRAQWRPALAAKSLNVAFISHIIREQQAVQCFRFPNP